MILASNRTITTPPRRDRGFEVKFVGTRIDIYATVASHHGPGTSKDR
jgi:hypothetical protein